MPSLSDLLIKVKENSNAANTNPSIKSKYNVYPVAKKRLKKSKLLFLNLSSYFIYIFNLLSPRKYVRYTSCRICTELMPNDLTLDAYSQVDACPRCLAAYGSVTRKIITDNSNNYK